MQLIVEFLAANVNAILMIVVGIILGRIIPWIFRIVFKYIKLLFKNINSKITKYKRLIPRYYSVGEVMKILDKAPEERTKRETEAIKKFYGQERRAK